MSLRDKYLAYQGRHPRSRMVFVLGTGRAGTHWLGEIIASHPDVRATVEKPAIFRKVTEAATNPSKQSRLLPRIIRRYRWEYAISAPRHYLDKSHPNIWLAEKLSASFPQARFVCIRRNPYAVVASMLKHPGVLRWCQQWDRYPVPNPFLGIDRDNVKLYPRMSLPARCALRWQSHDRQADHLCDVLGDRFKLVNYEALISDARPVLDELTGFLELRSTIPDVRPQPESLNKWRKVLSSSDCDDIWEVTGISISDAPDAT